MITKKRKKLLLIISTIIIMLNICVSFLAIFAEVIQKRSFDSLIIEGAFRIIMIERQ